jgi:hypothetical protein
MPRVVITKWKVQLTPMCGARLGQLVHLVKPWPSDGKRSALVRYCPPRRPGLSRGWVFGEVLGLFVGRQMEVWYDTPADRAPRVPLADPF